MRREAEAGADVRKLSGAARRGLAVIDDAHAGVEAKAEEERERQAKARAK